MGKREWSSVDPHVEAIEVSLDGDEHGAHLGAIGDVGGDRPSPAGLHELQRRLRSLGGEIVDDDLGALGRKWSAIALPMPDRAPVTTATLSGSLIRRLPGLPSVARHTRWKAPESTM